VDTLRTSDLVLEPLTAGHAEALFEVLRDPELYAYLDDGPPPSAEHLRGVYQELEARVSPDGSQLWLNWVIRPQGGPPAGFVQATVTGGDAWVAYVLARASWGRGYAVQATRAVVDHLRTGCGVTRFLATVDAGNERSARLLGRLGFRPATQAEAREQEIPATDRLYLLDVRVD
jgi:[ribosomal protein S5]-alanine N-acetyltransferase